MRKIKSFSIAEVIVAIMIFAVGILSVVSVFPIYKRMSRISEKSTIAAFLAQSKIEEIFSVPYDQIAVGAYEPRAAVATSGAYSVFERKTDISYIDLNFNSSATDQGLKIITTTVYWHEGSRERLESLITILADK